MKRKLLLLTATTLCLSVIGCSSDSKEASNAPADKQTQSQTESPSASPTIAPTDTPTITPSEEPSDDGVINFSDENKSTLVYTRHEFVKDYKDNNTLAVYFDYTNNTSDAKSEAFTFSTKAFQNGIECSTGILTSPSDEHKNSMKEVKTGKTISVCKYFILDDEASDIELEVSPLLSLSDEVDRQIIQQEGSTSKKNAATSKPDDKSEKSAVENIIQFAATDSSTLIYTKHEMTKKSSGESVLAVYFDYTNNSDKGKAAMYVFDIKAFQGGIECSSTIIADSAKEYQNTIKEIKTGATIPICFYFELDDKSTDVELEVGELFDMSDSNKATQTITLK